MRSEEYLKQLVKDWSKLCSLDFNKKYDTGELSLRESFGFMLGICHVLEMECEL